MKLKNVMPGKIFSYKNGVYVLATGHRQLFEGKIPVSKIGCISDTDINIFPYPEDLENISEEEVVSVDFFKRLHDD